MRNCTYVPLSGFRVLFTALMATIWLASCSSTKQAAVITAASRTNPNPLEASRPIVGAAAQSRSTAASQTSQSDAEDELMASTAVASPATQSSSVRLKEKLSQLDSRLSEAKSAQAVNGKVKHRKLSFPAKVLVNKLLKKTSRLSQKNITQVEAQEATQDSNSTLLIVGLLVIIIGLLLTLLATGTAQTIGIVALIVGTIVAVLALVG